MAWDLPRTSRRRKALLVKVVVALLLGALGVVAPLPRIVEQEAMATETRRPFVGQPAPDGPATTADPAAGTTTTSTPGGDGDGDGPEAPPASGPGATTDTSSTTVPEDATEASTTTTAPPAPAAEPDRVDVAEDTRDFSLIGVTLDAVPEGPVRVRTAPDDGPWGPWEELEFEVSEGVEDTPDPVPGAPVPEEPDDTAPGLHSDPLWVGDASRYELDLDAAVAEAAKVHLVYETTEKVAVSETAPAGADPADPTIHRRSSWGARSPKSSPVQASSLRIGVVHHSAGTNNYSSAQVPALLRGIQAYHMDANGWNDIGYNFAVDRFGRIWEARAGGVTRAIVGAHAAGFNTGSTGVVMLGEYGAARPTSAAVASVARIIAWKFAVHGVDPRTTVNFRAGSGSPRFAPGSLVHMNRIAGHSDVGLTACPGGNLYAQLGNIRTLTRGAWDRYTAPGLALVGNFAGSADTDIFLREEDIHSDQLLVSNGSSFTLRARYKVQGTRYRPRVGDFDGNGYDDIYWYGPGSVNDSIWLSRGDGRWVSIVRTVRGTYKPVVGDYDGNGLDDIVWYAPGSGAESLWLARGGGNFSHVSAPSVPYTLRPVSGDFDGDGDDDILWHGPGLGLGDSLWVAEDGRFTKRVLPNTRGSYLPETGDFDGDGDDDVFWYAPGSGAESVWLSDGLSFRSANVPNVRARYPYARTGDFGGDDRSEVLWYRSPGSDAIWWHASSTGLFGRSQATSPPLL